MCVRACPANARKPCRCALGGAACACRVSCLPGSTFCSEPVQNRRQIREEESYTQLAPAPYWLCCEPPRAAPSGCCAFTGRAFARARAVQGPPAQGQIAAAQSLSLAHPAVSSVSGTKPNVAQAVGAKPTRTPFVPRVRITRRRSMSEVTVRRPAVYFVFLPESVFGMFNLGRSYTAMTR